MEIEEILSSFLERKISVKHAKKMLSMHSIEKIGEFAKIDTDRKKRRGIPEVIYAENKQLEEIKKIIERVLKKSNSVVVSRIRKEHMKNLLYFTEKLGYTTMKGRNCSTIVVFKEPFKKKRGTVGIVTGGTSDIGIAEEARLMIESMNCKCYTSYDVGIAGLHRIIPVLKNFVNNDVDIIIVVAGMEGALATVVTSMVDMPVIGVPTSIGYGFGEKGIGALASMLQSCSLGLSVVNIDNGIAAGAIAANIANKINRS